MLVFALLKIIPKVGFVLLFFIDMFYSILAYLEFLHPNNGWADFSQTIPEGIQERLRVFKFVFSLFFFVI